MADENVTYAGNLSAFFAQNAQPIETVKVAVSKRFIDPTTGKPAEWELKAIPADKNGKLRNKNLKPVPVEGKHGVYTMQLDTAKYFSEMIAATVAFPNLSDAELQNSYGVMGEEALLGKMLLPGEYDNLLAAVQSVNGYDEDAEKQADEVQQVKN
ncbi:MAG TPA: phage portal protein [Ruminococcaceae bacterium]|jgi:hypothetical protein|nr:phage portal protein [Oscillospiraceae bacterium]